MKKIFLSRPSINSKELKSIEKVLASNFITEGDVTKKFEKSVSKYIHSKYAIATSSGTTALHTAFEAIGIKNKKILVSDFTFPATVLAIQQAQGIPVLVDVDVDSMNISREIIEEYDTKNISLICPVALFGNSLDKDFYRLKKNNFILIEDAATNLGTKLGEKFVGNISDITCFSFHPRKIITTGEGGMITTNKKEISEKIRSFKFFGKKNSIFMNPGTNYKISDILSSIGLTQMSKIEEIINKRRSLAKIYADELSKIDYFVPQKITKNSRHTFQSYVCKVTKDNVRNKIISKLSKKGIETQIGTYALHCLPAFSNVKKRGNLKNSKFLYEHSLSLPIHSNITENQIHLICKELKSIMREL